MNRVRVLHLVVGGDIGGAERLLVDLATRPDETSADHAVALLTPNPRLEEYFATKGLALHSRGLRQESPLRYLASSFGEGDVAWLVSLMKAERAEVLHTHTFGSHVLGTRAARRADVPQLRTEHHVMHYFDWDTRLFTRWAAGGVARFAAVSEYVLRVLSKTSPDVRTRGRLVRNGVSTVYFKPERPPYDGPPRAAIVCRLTRWKRVDLAIAAAALAKVALTVVGDGEERPRLAALAERLGADVTFVGHVEDPRPHILGASVVLSTAKDEPFGLSIVEALALERPVVAIRGGGVSETIREGEWGFLVDDATPQALAARIRDVVADPLRRVQMGRAGRRFVERSCDTLGMCSGYGRLYRELSGRA